jgi:acylphosphatase
LTIQANRKTIIISTVFFCMMRVRAEVKFSGRVQGVHFRDFTRRFAKKQNVCGWVMNQKDGSVAASFEGEKLDIEEVIRLLREEHPYARVVNVEVMWSPPRNDCHGFQVRH